MVQRYMQGVVRGLGTGLIKAEAGSASQNLIHRTLKIGPMSF